MKTLMSSRIIYLVIPIILQFHQTFSRKIDVKNDQKLFFQIKIRNSQPLFKPTWKLTKPYEELPGWKPAPIPIINIPNNIHFKPILYGTNVSICAKQFNISVPEIPSQVNILRDAVVYKNGQIHTREFLYDPETQIPKFSKSRLEVNVSNFEVIEEAIAFFHPYHKNYFHFMIETFPLLLLHGNETLKNCVILHHRFLTKLFNEMIAALDVKYIRTLFVGTPVVVRKLHISNPYIFTGYNQNAVLYMRNYILTKYGLNKNKPVKNILYNRNKNKYKNRLIGNFEEMVTVLNKTFPEMNFEFPQGKGFIDQACFWSKVRLVACAHGSLLANMIWMRSKTVALDFNTNVCFNAFVKLAKTLDIYIFETVFPIQYQKIIMTADIPLVIEMIKRANEILAQSSFE
ncbi:hypothetical protein TRFO_31958 [Tritrichomonas foetus]|uniref:Glycosyltransferase 61 catalytic domain-containing protein n=1 Tax=Tritrichomonas foetus TaxID=1144522 RepID=A0A1J4JUQ5_9EUKA|nr:hypothetical protein TRFO_31958 [Tritrichomonas foetus]|eukprot:OHT01252.1 hypothetical protein TRFO_31958 [Tritrichomonas foetus]